MERSVSIRREWEERVPFFEMANERLSAMAVVVVFGRSRGSKSLKRENVNVEKEIIEKEREKRKGKMRKGKGSANSFQTRSEEGGDLQR